MKVINIVHQKALFHANIAETECTSATALNQALKLSISADEFISLFGANRLTMSIEYDVQDEELFFDNITLDKVKSENNDYLVFCGGCFERNGSFYTVTAVIHSQHPEIRLYFSIAY